MSKEKKYRLKEEYRVVFSMILSDKALIGSYELDQWETFRIPIEALEEVKPKRITIENLETEPILNDDDFSDALSFFDFALNDLLPCGVKDKESFNKLAMEWFEYNYYNAQIEFTEYLKLKNK